MCDCDCSTLRRQIEDLLSEIATLRNDVATMLLYSDGAVRRWNCSLERVRESLLRVEDSATRLDVPAD